MMSNDEYRRTHNIEQQKKIVKDYLREKKNDPEALLPRSESGSVDDALNVLAQEPNMDSFIDELVGQLKFKGKKTSTRSAWFWIVPLMVLILLMGAGVAGWFYLPPWIENQTNQVIQKIEETPHEIVVTPAETELLADGTSTANLKIALLNRWGRPVSREYPLLIRYTDTSAKVTSDRLSVQNGKSEVTYTAGTRVGEARVTFFLENSKITKVLLIQQLDVAQKINMTVATKENRRELYLDDALDLTFVIQNTSSQTLEEMKGFVRLPQGVDLINLDGKTLTDSDRVFSWQIPKLDPQKSVTRIIQVMQKPGYRSLQPVDFIYGIQLKDGKKVEIEKLTGIKLIGEKSKPALKLKLKTDKPYLPADGTSTAKITVSVTDNEDRPVKPQSAIGLEVIPKGAGTLERESLMGSGEIVYIAGTTAGDVEIRARTDDLSASVTIQLQPVSKVTLKTLADLFIDGSSNKPIVASLPIKTELTESSSDASDKRVKVSLEIWVPNSIATATDSVIKSPRTEERVYVGKNLQDPINAGWTLLKADVQEQLPFTFIRTEKFVEREYSLIRITGWVEKTTIDRNTTTNAPANP
ncbi:MAG: hypothetical protein AB9888_12655 [Bacteroidales bacterium]